MFVDVPSAAARTDGGGRALDVIEDPARALVLLHPLRRLLLERLVQPASGATLARGLGEPRQRVNYHLRELERAGLVELVEERSHGSVTERVLRRSGQAYAIAPSALGALGCPPPARRERGSVAYQVDLCQRTLGELIPRLAAAKEVSGSSGLELELRVAGPERLAACANELAEAVADVFLQFHERDAADGIDVRLYLGLYPKTAPAFEPGSAPADQT